MSAHVPVSRGIDAAPCVMVQLPHGNELGTVLELLRHEDVAIVMIHDHACYRCLPGCACPSIGCWVVPDGVCVRFHEDIWGM